MGIKCTFPVCSELLHSVIQHAERTMYTNSWDTNTLHRRPLRYNARCSATSNSSRCCAVSHSPTTHLHWSMTFRGFFVG